MAAIGTALVAGGRCDRIDFLNIFEKIVDRTVKTR